MGNGKRNSEDTPATFLATVVAESTVFHCQETAQDTLFGVLIKRVCHRLVRGQGLLTKRLFRMRRNIYWRLNEVFLTRKADETLS